MTQESSAKELFWAELDTLGEEEVQLRVATGLYGRANNRSLLAKEWLRSKEASKLSVDSEKRVSREEEAISIAREANSFAREANKLALDANKVSRREARYAMYAAIVAAIAAIIAAKAEIYSLISWLQ